MVIKKQNRLYDLAVALLLIVIGLICFFPMAYIISVSLTPYEEYLRQGGIVLFPRQITFEAYAQFWKEPYVFECFSNTVFTTVLGTFCNIFVTCLMAYALSHKGLFMRRFFTVYCLIPMLISGGLVPTYLVVKNTGLINSLASLIIPSLVSPYILLITRSFFSGIDAGMYESARIDGAGEFRILFTIILPVSAPILATIGLMYGVGHWNQYFASLMYISDSGKRTLQVVLREMLSRASSMEADVAIPTRTLQMAGVVISAVPIIMVYPFLQRHFTQGIMLGAIKG